MEIKWIAIAFIGIMGTAMVSTCISEYEEGQCKIASVQSGMKSEDIIQLCKTK
jgi:hypothetical protein